MSDDIVTRAIATVKSKARGRTRYEGQEPFIDETLVAEIERLRAVIAGWEDPDRGLSSEQIIRRIRDKWPEGYGK